MHPETSYREVEDETRSDGTAPGDFSLDHAFGIEVKGPLVALAALIGGTAGAELMTRSSAAQSEQAGEPDVQPAAPAPSGSEPVHTTA